MSAVVILQQPISLLLRYLIIMSLSKSPTELTDVVWIALYHDLVSLSMDMNLSRKTYGVSSKKYGGFQITVKKIWSSRNQGNTTGEVVQSAGLNRKVNCGKHLLDINESIESLMSVPPRLRQIHVPASEAIGILASTLRDFLQRLSIWRKNKCINPLLSEKNKIQRLKWYLEFVENFSLTIYTTIITSTENSLISRSQLQLIFRERMSRLIFQLENVNGRC